MKKFKFIDDGKITKTLEVRNNKASGEIPDAYKRPPVLKDVYSIEEYLTMREKAELNQLSLLIYNTGLLLERS